MLVDNSIIVYCGNGGDWEWLNDKYLWEVWVTHNMPGIKFLSGIDSKCRADELRIKFENIEDVTVFKLKSPRYITYTDVERYLTTCK